MTVSTSRARPLRLAVAGAALITLVAATFAPLLASEPEADDVGPGASGVIIQAVEDGVWNVVSDGAGHALFGSDDSITFDPDGHIVMCCDAGRERGEEVEQVFRFGEAGAIAVIGPYMDVPYPRQLHVDSERRLWLADLVFDGERWSTSAKRMRDADGFYHLSDGSVWAGLLLDRPGVARLADGEWTKFTDKTGFPRLAGDWGEIADVEADADGSVWVAVRGMRRDKPGGLARFDGQVWHVQRPLGMGRKAGAEALASAPDGSLWAYLVDSRGKAHVARFDGAAWSVFGEADGVPSTSSADDFTPVFMEVDPQGKLWLTPRVGWECSELVSFDGSKWTRHMDGACIKQLAIGPGGAAWVSARWQDDEDFGSSSGLYVITPEGAVDFFDGATEVERAQTEDEALLADTHIACVTAAPNAEARAMCDLLAPLAAEAIREAVGACGGGDPVTDGEAMCLGFFAPMLASSLRPPPWRDGMDVKVAAAYLDESAPYEPPTDEPGAIDALPEAERSQAWTAAADRDDGFAALLEGLSLPASVDVLVADTAERWRALAATERALADAPTAGPARGDYVSALASARVAETGLRWILGLPPRASTAMAVLNEPAFLGDPASDLRSGPAATGKPSRVLGQGRSGHEATRLDDGRVLLTGGFKADTPSQRHLVDVEAYLPGKGRFGDVGRLKTARAGHWATPLSDGTVLIIGGGGLDRPITRAEVFDPVTGSSKRIQGPKGLFQIDAVTMLDDGRVLLVAPTRERAASAWLFDPASGTFDATGAPLEPRAGGTATLLDDGTVLLVGGIGDYYTNQAEVAELFDPASGAFEVVGRPLRSRSEHTATRLADGRVLLAGGASGLNSLASAELFDPATRTFTPTGALRGTRYGHQATLLDDGRVLITGGSDPIKLEGTRSVELYDPATGRFSQVGWLTESREGEAATLLEDGRVLITGGGRAGGATAEIFDPATWESTALTPQPK